MPKHNDAANGKENVEKRLADFSDNAKVTGEKIEEIVTSGQGSKKELERLAKWGKVALREIIRLLIAEQLGLWDDDG